MKEEYYKMIDAALVKLNERFVKQEGLREHEKLERLLSAEEKVDVDRIKASIQHWPPELEIEGLKSELEVFKKKYQCSCLKEYVGALTGLAKNMRPLFPNLENLVRLLIALPSSSATAERSFSGLRRLKTWLRSKMGQKRLNSVAVLHTHRERVSRLQPRNVIREFVALNPGREAVFGRV